jgi:hypothetical protein
MRRCKTHALRKAASTELGEQAEYEARRFGGSPDLVIKVAPIARNRRVSGLLIFALCSPSISVCATLSILHLYSAVTRVQPRNATFIVGISF